MMAIVEMIFCQEWYVDRDLPQKSPPSCPTDAAFIARVLKPCALQAYSITALLCVHLRDLGSKHGATNTIILPSLLILMHRPCRITPNSLKCKTIGRTIFRQVSSTILDIATWFAKLHKSGLNLLNELITCSHTHRVFMVIKLYFSLPGSFPIINTVPRRCREASRPP